jgi:hypothetical protein
MTQEIIPRTPITVTTQEMISPAKARLAPFRVGSALSCFRAIVLNTNPKGQIVKLNTNPKIENRLYFSVVTDTVVVILFLKLVGVSSLYTYSGVVSQAYLRIMA